jgi:BirA family biotin operon repressor/biotin-[acetyl-CoA-carboxylase] ligase
MELPKSANLTPRLIWRDQAGSTNLELIELAQAESLPDFTVLLTANQVAGRGRSGRVWQAPAGTSLAISVLLRPRLDASADLGKLGWLPLLGGLAMAQNVQGLLPELGGDAANGAIGVKWPNDVLVNERKISGVLTELVTLKSAQASPQFGPSTAVVIGAGINLTITDEELPVPTATSLRIAGATLPDSLDERLDLVLSGYLERLNHWYQRFTEAKLSAVVSGLREAVIESCVSLNREVRAILPGDSEQVGRAVTIDDSGKLVLEVAGGPFAVAAGDIVHLRHN